MSDLNVPMLDRNIALHNKITVVSPLTSEGIVPNDISLQSVDPIQEISVCSLPYSWAI
jgi:hypothetical protein